MVRRPGACASVEISTGNAGSAMTKLMSTTVLLAHVADGDLSARDTLMARYLPRLRHWAHGRLPQHGRDLAETDDLVQVTLLRSLNHLSDFENHRPGAFLAYLRTILMNALRDEIRRAQRRPVDLAVSISQLVGKTSVVEEVVGAEVMDAYEAALAKLPEEKRLAIVMRIEFGMSYQEITEELQRDSVNGTRMMIVRALTELAEVMQVE